MTGSERVVLGMSGGVDSSVAAALLRDGGAEVVGVTLRLTDEDDACARVGSCCSPADIADARAAAAALGIPHYVVDEREAFRQQVVNPFVREHALGRTPSPCVHCNPGLKFAALFRFGQAIGAGAVATGHYARVTAGPDGQLGLHRGRDLAKDQSYFLYALPPAWLARLRFPVGELTKPQVRELAARLALPTAAKRDSQQLCFVADGDHRRFVEERGGAGKPGLIVDTAGAVVASHPGTHAYTIGQRKGIPAGHRGQRRFVVRIDAARGLVVVGAHEELARDELSVSRLTWLVPPSGCVSCVVQIRYRATPVPAWVELTDDSSALIRLRQPAHGVAPGQAAVFYSGDQVLGGGLID